MHYIIGTSFKVTPASRTLLKDRRFQAGNAYSLIYIKKNSDKLVYMFMDLSRNKIELEFNNCREADTLIAKLRNEKIPNYEEVKEVVDTIAD